MDNADATYRLFAAAQTRGLVDTAGSEGTQADPATIYWLYSDLANAGSPTSWG